MTDIRFSDEQDLIHQISKSTLYEAFIQKGLPAKIERERRAALLLQGNRGGYTQEVLNQIFDTVDLFDGKKRWFGSLLAAPNRNLIFQTPLETINEWLDELLFRQSDPKQALDICLGPQRIKGAGKGLATLLLYLVNPQKYNIWLPATEEGLSVLGRLGELKGQQWGENYLLFNQAAIEFRNAYHLPPQAVDWWLSFIYTYVEVDEENLFRISEEVFQTNEPAASMHEEADLDDVVGQPMELGVMRWTPTNEMGVVALFIEYRKELGFPLIELIRTSFPDAAVFEEAARGYVRRYIEFEYKSSGYKSHLRSKRKCHYVVCWEHDWKDCPIPVIELKTEIPKILAQKR